MHIVFMYVFMYSTNNASGLKNTVTIVWSKYFFLVISKMEL